MIAADDAERPVIATVAHDAHDAPTTLIVNADDLGLSRCVNRGIERAHREGVVTSATLLPNGDAFADGVRVARDNPKLGVGVHLNLVRGAPVAEPQAVLPLLGPNGRFGLTVPRLRKACRAPATCAAARVEYRAQIAKVRAAGIEPTHLDFEKHHALWRPLYEVAAELARAEGVGLRRLREPVGWVMRRLPWPGWRRVWRMYLLRLYVQGWHPPARDLPPGPDHFLGQSHIGAIDEPFLRGLIAHPPPGVAEVMCHPGDWDAEEMDALPADMRRTSLETSRERETAALTAPGLGAALTSAGCRLATYGALHDRFSNLTPSVL